MLRRRKLAEPGLALAMTLAVTALFWQGRDWPLVRELETWSLDLRLRLRAPPHLPGDEIALVVVDDRSLAKLGRWPFSRRLIGTATGVIDGMGAKAIVFDLLFSEPEKPIPDDMQVAAREAGHRLARASPGLAQTLHRLADDDPDTKLAADFARSGKVLVPFAFTFESPAAGDGTTNATLETAAYAELGTSPRPPFFPLRPTAVLMPVPEIAAAAAGLGHVNVAFDADSAPRYEYAALPYGADFLPSLSMRAVALYRGLPWSQVSLALGGGVDFGPLHVPTDSAMRLLVDYRGPRGTFATYSFADVVEGRVPKDAFRDRIVLVGAAAVGINDTFRTPFGSAPLPGVERMANVIDTALHGDFISRPDALPAAEAAAAVAAALTIGIIGAFLPTSSVVATWTAGLILWAVAAQVALGRGLWLSVASPLIALGLGMMTALAWRIVVVDREERQVRSAFRRYLAPALVAELAAHPERLRLGGETREMTVLFCDIRNFTTLSESISEQDLVRLLNGLFTPMVDVILRHHGTVDKFIGDCVMAFWNAPLDDPEHARHACQAASAMLAAAERQATRRLREGSALPPITVGIGLNTGPCCVGNLGSEQRFDYSVVGDAVNVASRMEGLTKTYGVRLIAADPTRTAAPDLPWLVLDEVLVKGRTTPVRAHTVWTGSAETLAILDPLHRDILVALAENRRADGQRLLAEARAAADGKLITAHDILATKLGAKAGSAVIQRQLV